MTEYTCIFYHFTRGVTDSELIIRRARRETPPSSYNIWFILNYFTHTQYTYLLHPWVPASTYALLHALEHSDVIRADSNDIVPGNI